MPKPSPFVRFTERARMALLLTKRRRYILLISHMRSYSSLLGHILGSHPEIAGYVETHHSYRTDLDLVELALKIYHTNDRHLDGEILFDKILHGQYEISDYILRRKDVSLLLAVREPLATVRSTVAMAMRRKKPDWKADPAKVGGYYLRRLADMETLAARNPARSAFLVADDLLTRTDEVLAGLTGYLQLHEPLKPTYETFEFTGKPIYGDPGEHIGAGAIVRERDEHAEVAIGDDLAEKLTGAYASSVERLSDLCQIRL